MHLPLLSSGPMSELWLPFLLALLAGLSTGVGSLISLLIKDFKQLHLNFVLGLSAGVMLHVSFVELLGSAIADVGFLAANVAFFAGIVFLMLLDFFIPHNYLAERANVAAEHTTLMRMGTFTAIGIAIHNLPEGLAVFVSALGDLALGVPLAIAIALHNIPEGVAISMPIYYATKSRAKAFMYSLLAGIAEPVGALIGIVVLLPFLDATLLAYMLAFVGGIMVFISFDELLPHCMKSEKHHVALSGLLTGMLIMATSLQLLA